MDFRIGNAPTGANATAEVNGASARPAGSSGPSLHQVAHAQNGSMSPYGTWRRNAMSTLMSAIEREADSLYSLRVFRLLPSRPREFHPEPLTDSGREPLDSSGSCHRAKAAAFR